MGRVGDASEGSSMLYQSMLKSRSRANERHPSFTG